jgi:hypothetical protein
MKISQTLVFTDSRGGGISLQFNADACASGAGYCWPCGQTNCDWFQAGIQVDTYGDAWFWVYVWNGSNIAWEEVQGPVYSIAGVFNAGTLWFVTENVNSNNKISSVSYEIYANGVRYIESINVPANTYNWIRSQLCLCGFGGGSYATFSSGSGTFTYPSNAKLQAIGPPSDLGTAEDSNMGYGCMQGSGTYSMSQSFQLGSHC